MNILDRRKGEHESDKEYKKKIADFYKSERALLKQEPDLKLEGKQPKDLAELIYRLHVKKEATFNVSNNVCHCTSGRYRTENDLYLCLRHYYKKNVQFKFGSEILYGMLQESLLTMHFCNTINRHCYSPKNLTISEEKYRLYLEEKNLNIKFA
jgi:hypothetical protein